MDSQAIGFMKGSSSLLLTILLPPFTNPNSKADVCYIKKMLPLCSVFIDALKMQQSQQFSRSVAVVGMRAFSV